jgi:thioredoxin-related protein
MDKDTWPREDVQKFLSAMVCVKVNPGKGKDQKKLYDGFAVTGVPTLLLIDPSGKELVRCGGKPPPDSFIGAFVNKAWNALADAEKSGDMKAAAEQAFYLKTWFPETDAGKRAADAVAKHSADEAFKKTLDELQSAHDRTTLLNRGNWQLRMRKKAEAEAAFRELVEAHPDSKEAEEAKKTLKKMGVKLEAPPK